jgi:hypothetical protein
MNLVTEIVHYFGIACLIASLLMRILPTPEEINWKPYSIIHGMIHRASLNLPSGGSNANAAK